MNKNERNYILTGLTLLVFLAMLALYGCGSSGSTTGSNQESGSLEGEETISNSGGQTTPILNPALLDAKFKRPKGIPPFKAVLNNPTGEDGSVTYCLFDYTVPWDQSLIASRPFVVRAQEQRKINANQIRTPEGENFKLKKCKKYVLQGDLIQARECGVPGNHAGPLLDHFFYEGEIPPDPPVHKVVYIRRSQIDIKARSTASGQGTFTIEIRAATSKQRLKQKGCYWPKDKVEDTIICEGTKGLFAGYKWRGHKARWWGVYFYTNGVLFYEEEFERR